MAEQQVLVANQDEFLIISLFHFKYRYWYNFKLLDTCKAALTKDKIKYTKYCFNTRVSGQLVILNILKCSHYYLLYIL